jgi:hypothetical protein
MILLHTAMGQKNLNVTNIAVLGHAQPYVISSSVSGNVQRAEFKMDGKVFAVDYDAPFEAYLLPSSMGISAAELLGIHNLEVDVYDDIGQSSYTTIDWDNAMDCLNSPVDVERLAPGPGFAVYTETNHALSQIITVQVYAAVSGWRVNEYSGRHGPYFDFDEFYLDEFPVDYVELLIDHSVVATSYTGAVWDPLHHIIEYDPAGLVTGSHCMTVRAWSSNECPRSDSMTFDVTAPSPHLIYSRDVYPRSNCFEVVISLHNDGSGSATLTTILEKMTGFFCYCPSNEWVGTWYNEYNETTHECSTYYFLDQTRTLAPGETASFTNRLVPVLYSGNTAYRIGGEGLYNYIPQPSGVATTVLTYCETRLLSWPWHRTTLDEAVEDAILDADYILVTDPYRLLGHNDRSLAMDVLERMTELAGYRNGVLGFFNGEEIRETDFRQGDILTSGRFYGLDEEDIMVGDLSEEHLKPYGLTGLLDFRNPSIAITSRVYQGDAVVLGNVRTNRNSALSYLDEMLLLHGAHGTQPEGTVTLIQYHPGGNFIYTDFPDTDYQEGDQAAAGYFFEPESAGGVKKLVVASGTSGDFLFYDGISGSPLYSIDAAFISGDLLAVGNVVPASREVLAWGDVSLDTVYVYKWNIMSYDFDRYTALSFPLEEHDAMAVGNVWGHGRDELVIVDESEDVIHIYQWDEDHSELEEINTLAVPFYPEDALTVAHAYRSGNEQICIARGANHGTHHRGDLDILICADGETPGTREDLDTLLSRGGGWARRLSSNWLTNGYLLLVGETDIIPAFSHDIYLAWNTKYGDVDYSDRNYASTFGSSHYPEVGIGRIPGRTASTLRMTLNSICDVLHGETRFINRDAVTMSGASRGPSGDAAPINFFSEMMSIRDILYEHDFLHCIYEHEPVLGEFVTNCVDRDIIFLAGHGSESSWDGIAAADVRANLNVGETHPLVYADACLTGRYPHDDNFARTFLERGASCYIGATEVGIFPWSKRLAQAFFRKFTPNVPAGKAMKDAIRYRVSGKANYLAWDMNYNKYTCAMFSLMGDPKQAYSNDPMMLARSTNRKAPAYDGIKQGPLSSLHVDIPDYEVFSTDGVDHVSISDQPELFYPGYPTVPVFLSQVHFPPGYDIQDVVLDQRTAGVTSNGLVLSVASAAVMRAEGTPASYQNRSSDNWWPPVTSDWEVVQLPDESSMLNITIYPFSYNTQTTDFIYYQDYDFLIDYTTNAVSFNRLVLEQPNYDPGDTVRVNCYILSTNSQPMDVTLKTQILTNGNVIAENLGLRSLDNMQALSSCVIEWDSSGFPANDYGLEVELLAPDQTILARDTLEFTLGQAACRVGDFTIAPADYKYGDDVAIDVQVDNIGSKTLDGTLVVLVMDADGNHCHDFRYDFESLSAGQSLVHQFDWTDADLVSRNCSIFTYVLYNGKTSLQDGFRSWEDAPLEWDAIVYDGNRGTVVKWPSTAGRTYTLELCTNLSAHAFAVLTNQMGATPPQNVFTNPASLPAAFYRVIEQWDTED